jgi:uncharacterized protein YjbJ (UPF0337 family)
MWNKDEIRGKAEKAKGHVKQEIADATDDERLRSEGEADEAAGELQEGFGKARRKIGEAINKIGDRIGR